MREHSRCKDLPCHSGVTVLGSWPLGSLLRSAKTTHLCRPARIRTVGNLPLLPNYTCACRNSASLSRPTILLGHALVVPACAAMLSASVAPEAATHADGLRNQKWPHLFPRSSVPTRVAFGPWTRVACLQQHSRSSGAVGHPRTTGSSG